jgi:hypothetical protein
LLFHDKDIRFPDAQRSVIGECFKPFRASAPMNDLCGLNGHKH